MEISFDLTMAWALLIATAIFIYVVLDGFDLGIGILYPLFPKRRDRDLMMNSVAPVWDGNETWLVLGGGGLFAAFPLAYAILMPAFYIPILIMLLALVFRGVAFEFRWRTTTDRARTLWDMAFFGGSALAALSQGVILGALLDGVAVEGRAFAGGPWDWARPFPLLTGLAVMSGYTLLGACWLILKTEGAIQTRVRGIARISCVTTLAAIVAVSLATPFLEVAYWERWFSWPNLVLSAFAPLVLGVLAHRLWRTLGASQRDWEPIVLVLFLFLLTFAGLGISIWPFIIPTSVTIYDAATPFYSQIFMFVGAVIMIPIILAYTGYAYWVFRGKLDPEQGYH